MTSGLVIGMKNPGIGPSCCAGHQSFAHWVIQGVPADGSGVFFSPGDVVMVAPLPKDAL